jgi:hypothetical protein
MEYLKTVIYLFSVLISGEMTEYMVPNIADIQQVIYVDIHRVLLVNEDSILEVNVLKRDVKEIGKRGNNEFVGYDNSLMFCKIEHYIIQSEKEFSTKFTVLNKQREVVKELYFFETIRPLYINRDIIIATTAVDFLEKHFYKIYIESGEIEEIFLKDVQKKENIVNVREDVFGNIWVSYSTRDMIKMIIPILKLNLKTMLNIIPMNVPRPALIP